MSPGYGGYQSTTPPPCYTTTTFAPTGYYTEDHNYYTTKAPEYFTSANAAPSLITKDPEYYTEAPKYYTTKSPEYYTYVAPAYTPRLPSITQFLATTPKLQLITPPKRLNIQRAAQILHHQGSRVLHHNLCFPEPLHRSPEVLLCPKLHNYNWGGQVLRSPDLLHSSFVLRWTGILHRGSSLLHHNPRYT